MRKELFETGKSVDIAIDSACEKLGCSREDCEWEIIDLPKKGFLGLKNTPAKVRVSVEVPDEKPETVSEEKSKPERIANQQKTEKPKQDRKFHEQKPREQKANTYKAKETVKEPVKPEMISEKEKLAKDYLAQVLNSAGLKADCVVTREHGGSCINIVGDGLGMIIGRRGETLDAIQYLTGLVANRGEGDYMRLTIDCGDYRLKRKDTLEALSRKLAGQVLKTNVSKTLEPMNPFERRIIHATVSEIEGVSSSSIGEEPNRRVVITSPTARPAPRSGYRSDRRDGEGGGYSRNRGPRRDNRPAGGNPERFAGSAEGERPQRQNRDDRNNGRRGGYEKDRRGASRPPRPTTAVPQGPPKQTPESEKTSGISFGKIDLE